MKLLPLALLGAAAFALWPSSPRFVPVVASSGRAWITRTWVGRKPRGFVGGGAVMPNERYVEVFQEPPGAGRLLALVYRQLGSDTATRIRVAAGVLPELQAMAEADFL